MAVLPKQSFLFEMLGLKPIMEAMQSPEAQALILGLPAAIAETHQGIKRIEEKLDRLLAAMPQVIEHQDAPPLQQFTDQPTYALTANGRGPDE